MPTTNRRIYYPTHAFGLAPLNSTTYTPVHGAQALGVNTNFQLDPISELGQSSIYQLVEQVPEIECTSEKVLDGYCPMYHLSTQGASDGSLIGRSNQRCMLAMSVYGDTQQSSSGVPQSQVQCSGMYWSQLGLSFGTDAPFKESLTWVGNDKTALTNNFTFSPTFTNNDLPLALAGSGGVQIRQDFIFYPQGGNSPTQENSTTLDINGQVAAFLSILPPDVAGISSSGTNDRQTQAGGVYDFNCHVTSVSVNCSAGREAVLELGRKDPYFRFFTVPAQVTCEIAIIAGEADSINASELGVDGHGNNLVNRSIRIRCLEGSYIDLGTNNKLTSVSFQGGGTDGGQVTTTYSYITYNYLYFAHPQDPMVLLGTIPYPY